MDLVLEVSDYLVGDYVFAWAKPLKSPPYSYNASEPSNGPIRGHSSWQYKPAASFLPLEPSEAAYMSAWDRSNMTRQAISLFLITWIFGVVLYWVFATLSFYFIFDHRAMQHPKYIKNQISKEVKQAMQAMPVIAVLTTPCWLLEVNGYTKLYDSMADGPGLWYEIFQFPFFILFTDACIYLIHRWLHLPSVYKYLHKPHHKWIVPTPYASYAFHPLDGFAQSAPYHIFPMLFPLNKYMSVGLFVFVNFWTILIHDGEYLANSPVINGAACHTYHHLYFNYNYGQYTTLWDRLGNSYRKPEDVLFQKDKKMSEAEWKKQTQGAEEMVAKVEGKDDRLYDTNDTKKNK